MFKKYEKTYRITTPRINVAGKLNLTKDEMRDLFTGTIQITEKMDGSNVAIIRGKGDKWTLQKRRGLADEGVHAQFSFFWNWARHNEEKILDIQPGWIFYGELMYAKHHIYYDQLPSYFLVFDIWNGREYIRNSADVASGHGFKHVPVLWEGNGFDRTELDKLISKSAYATDSVAEGVVVKNHRKQMRGKLVRPEFMKELDEDESHWMMKSVTRNKLRENASAYD